ncbi:hypothetical protein N8217_07770 [Glaciecola sp.]|nr:hypothetical protein [Glaciecola sp.]
MDYIEYIIYALIFFYLVGRFSTKEDKAHKQVRKKNSEPTNEKKSISAQTYADDDNFLKTSRQIESLKALNEVILEKIEQAKEQKKTQAC